MGGEYDEAALINFILGITGAHHLRRLCFHAQNCGGICKIDTDFANAL